MGKPSRLAKGERGSVAVEFTLLLPVFLLLVFAVIELGSAWYFRQMLVNASREGARLAAMYSQEASSDATVEAAVGDLLTQAGFPGQPVVVATGTAANPGQMVTVSVSALHQFPVLSGLIPGVVGSLTLTATTAMRHE